MLFKNNEVDVVLKRTLLMTLVIKIKYPQIFLQMLNNSFIQEYLLNTNRSQTLHKMLRIQKHTRQSFSLLQAHSLEGNEK